MLQPYSVSLSRQAATAPSSAHASLWSSGRSIWMVGLHAVLLRLAPSLEFSTTLLSFVPTCGVASVQPRTHGWWKAPADLAAETHSWSQESQVTSGEQPPLLVSSTRMGSAVPASQTQRKGISRLLRKSRGAASLSLKTP